MMKVEEEEDEEEGYMMMMVHDDEEEDEEERGLSLSYMWVDESDWLEAGLHLS
jgi:hypothetical protein